MAASSSIATDCLGYTPIPVDLLQAEDFPIVDLHIKDMTTGNFRLYRASDVPMQPEDLLKLHKMGIQWIYAADVDHAMLQATIRHRLERLVCDESIGLQERFGRLNQVVHKILESAFEADDTDELVCVATHAAGLAVQLLEQDELTASDLIGLMFHDFQTVTHSLNISYLLAMLAKEMQLEESSEQLTKIALAGLLHDIGKLSISDRILHSKERLKPQEQRIARKHPILGFRRLCRRPDFSLGQLMVVYQHHERTDGSGFPVGAVGNEIHPWARACSVVNLFESLTSRRPYRQRYPIAEAITLMNGQLGKGLDQEMYQCWTHVIRKK